MIEFSVTIPALDRIAAAIERLVFIHSAARFSFELKLGEIENMPVYQATRPDFDFVIVIAAEDSEDNIIPDAPIPAGHILTVLSSNPAAFEVTQDGANPKLVHAHVGGPNPDGSPSQATVRANLFDPANTLVATGEAAVTVTAGDPAEILSINLNLPE